MVNVGVYLYAILESDTKMSAKLFLSLSKYSACCILTVWVLVPVQVECVVHVRLVVLYMQ